LSKQTQNLLCAHERELSVIVKENTAVCFYRQNYVSSNIFNFDITRPFYNQCIISSFALFHSYCHYLSYAQKDENNLAPNKSINFCSQTNKFEDGERGSTFMKLRQNNDQATANSGFCSVPHMTHKLRQR
jgi:hypothetical protein